jgi:hypothetical protein
MAMSACLLMAQGDPPGRVARLSYMFRAVSFRPAGVDDWFPADFNRPLTTGDSVFSDFTSTAELQIGSAALRLSSTTSFQFLNLDDSNVQIRLDDGRLIVRLRYLGDQDSFEVDTPNGAFSLLRAGEYRIDVKPDSSTTIVTVRGGEGELTGSNQALTIHAGEQVQVTGADQPNYQTIGAPPRDVFDSWSAERDLRDDQSPSARYVSRELVGYQDLDQYGSWRTTPEFGAVWVPKGTPGGWAPYHFGHWLWVDPWGWTWVDDAPWGFAPFHYGRWAYVGGSWGWIPGPIAQVPVYAPALVAWVGGGAIGGGVAWFALGPREVFVPTYHTSPTYLTQINVTNTVIVNNTVTNINITNVNYVNRAAPGAVMAVQQAAFASAKPVQSAAIVVQPEALKSATVVATAAVAPTRASVMPTAAPGAKVVKPPAAVQAAPVVAKRTPPPPPVPFAQKQQALAANAGRPLDVNQVQQLRQKQPPPAPLVKQVQARAPTPAPAAAKPASGAPGKPAPSPAAPAPAAAVRPEPAARPAPQPKEATPEARPAPTPEPAKAAAPAAPRAEPPKPAPSAEEKKPAPEPAAKPAAKPAPKKDDKADKDKKKKEEKKDDKDKN